MRAARSWRGDETIGSDISVLQPLQWMPVLLTMPETAFALLLLLALRRPCCCSCSSWRQGCIGWRCSASWTQFGGRHRQHGAQRPEHASPVSALPPPMSIMSSNGLGTTSCPAAMGSSCMACSEPRSSCIDVSDSIADASPCKTHTPSGHQANLILRIREFI